MRRTTGPTVHAILRGRVGSIIGSALACEDIARPGHIGDTGALSATALVPRTVERRMLFFGTDAQRYSSTP